MSYLGYVVAAYAVFVLVMVWDWLSPRLQVHRELRRVRLRAARQIAHAQRSAGRAPSEELTR